MLLADHLDRTAVGQRLVNGEVETRRGRMLHEGDVVEVGDERLEVG